MTAISFEEIQADDEILQIIREELENEYWGKFVLYGEERVALPCLYSKYANEIKNLEVYDDDIWVIAYPKSGTTWTQEMVWMIANNVDFEGSKADIHKRVPFLERAALMDREKMYEKLNVPAAERPKHTVQMVKDMPRPRIIKTHLPFSLLPEQIRNGTRTPKIVGAIRNPKDTCVSFYHHGCLLQGWETNLENFTKIFMLDIAMYGSYWKHLFGYWNRRNLPNIHVIKYEDMKKDLASIIREVAQFLEKNITEEQVQLLCEHLSFESMQSNPAVNLDHAVELMKKIDLVKKDGKFIRSGTVGKYKEELSPETVNKFNEWIKENIKGTDLENEYIFQI